MRGVIRIGVGYGYEMKLGETLGDYNVEAQGGLLADYFAIKTGSAAADAPDAVRRQPALCLNRSCMHFVKTRPHSKLP